MRKVTLLTLLILFSVFAFSLTLMAQQELDTVVCPYCGAEIPYAELEEGEGGESICPYCGEGFEIGGEAAEETMAPADAAEEEFTPSLTFAGKVYTELTLYSMPFSDGDEPGRSETLHDAMGRDNSAFTRLDLGLTAMVTENTGASALLRFHGTMTDRHLNANAASVISVYLLKANIFTTLFDVVQLRMGRHLSKYQTSEFFGRGAFNTPYTHAFLVPIFVNDAIEVETKLDIPFNFVLGYTFQLEDVSFANFYFVGKLGLPIGDDMKLGANLIYTLSEQPGTEGDRDYYSGGEIDINFAIMGMLIPYVNLSFLGNYDGARPNWNTGRDLVSKDPITTTAEDSIMDTMLLSGGIRFIPEKISQDYLFWFKAIVAEFEVGGLSGEEHMYNLFLHATFAYQEFYFDYGFYMNLYRFDDEQMMYAGGDPDTDAPVVTGVKELNSFSHYLRFMVKF